jgi:hypothetical protein
MRLSPPVTSSREFYLDPRQPRFVVRDKLTSAQPRQVTWRFHFDPAVAVELVGTDCRVRSGDKELWVLSGDASDGRTRRLERGWVSASYGTRSETAVLVISNSVMPATMACIFAETHLGAGDRRALLEQLDAHGAHP